MSEIKDDEDMRKENDPLKAGDPSVGELRKLFDAFTIHELDDMDKDLDANEKKELVNKAKHLGISETETLSLIKQWLEETGTSDADSTSSVPNIAPRIKSFTPCPCAEGEEVTIIGGNLSGTAFVSFGGTEASKFTVDSNTQITATVGSGSSGAIEVRTQIGNTYYKGFRKGFKFVKLPVISKFTPDSAKSGVEVIIKGKHFTGTDSVSFGGTVANKFTVDSDNQITAVVGRGSSGVVEVSTGEGKATVQGFKHIRLPAITKFTPESAKSGAEITINGSNFMGTTAVTFGGTDALGFTVDSDTTITAIIGSGSSGSIEVTTTEGKASLSGFRLIAPPVVNGFSPVNATSGDTVTITGRNYTGASDVSFGGAPASKFTVDSDTQITAIIGLGNHGAVEVKNQEGKSSKPGFKFIGPIINSISPENAGEGDTVTITGINLTGAISVSFGEVGVSKFTVNSDTRITAIIGAGNTGQVEVKTRDGKASLPGFKFIGPVLNGLSPTTAKRGDTVTIKGVNLTGTTVVSFGGYNASKFTIDSDTRITAIVGTGNTGQVEVKTCDGKASLSGFKFSGPVINEFSPTTAKRGDTVIITGANLSDTTSVRFGGNAASKFTVVSDKQISASVSSGSSGSVRIDTPFGTATRKGFVFKSKVPFLTACALSILMFPVWYCLKLFKNDPLSIAKITIFTLIPVWLYIIDRYALRQFLNRLKSPYLFIAPIVLFLGFSIILNDYLFTHSILFHRPIITGFEPAKAKTGDSLTIKGKHFSNVTSVLLGGTEATISNINIDRTEVTAVVGEGNTGKVSVKTTSRGNGESHKLFTYLPKPIINSFKPPEAKTGITVTIEGRELSGVTSVKFGDVDAKNFKVESDTRITAVVGKECTGGIRITTPGGTSISSENFIYIPPQPRIIDFDPKKARRGEEIIIQGNNFIKKGTTVKFGGTDAEKIDVDSDTQITATLGKGSTGVVSVETRGGPVIEGGFTFIYNPVISNFFPDKARSGKDITIIGEHFEDVKTVMFGGEKAVKFTFHSDNRITAVIGRGNTGKIFLITKDGFQSEPSKSDFRYIPPDPKISKFVPTAAGKGDKVTIMGEHFEAVETVMFGGAKAQIYKKNPEGTEIIVVVGKGNSGEVSVATSESKEISREVFTYLSEPVITSFFPQEAKKGDLVIIKGRELSDITSVKFGDVEAKDIKTESDSQISAIVGNGSTGEIRITTPGGTVLSSKSFKYILPKPVINSFYPDKANTGEKVTIVGKYFKDVMHVTFGGTDVEKFDVNANGTTITAVVRDGSSGSISITAQGGAATTDKLFTFVGGHYEYLKKRKWVDTSRKKRVWVPEHYEKNRRVEGHYEEKSEAGHWQEYEEKVWIPEQQIPRTWEDVKVQIAVE